MTYNENEIDAEELFELIGSISKFVEKEIKMYALGGTALTILNIKKSTRDVDISIESTSEYQYICKIFEDLIEIKFREWKFSLDNDLIGEVKGWGL